MTAGGQLPDPGDLPARRLPVALVVFRRVLDLITAIAAAAVILLLVGLFLIVASQFVDRYLHPVWGGIPAEEYVKVALVWLTFLGFGVAVRAGAEICVDLIDGITAVAVRRWMYGFFDVLVCVVLGVVLWKGARLYVISSGQLILGTDMTVAVPALGMLLGIALTGLSIVERLVMRFYPQVAH